tara:strand:- start:622 stop:2376 length:1755 start_codon:yes stop_codon:yes gene_type:complete
MGFFSKLKASISLDTDKFSRQAKGAKRDLKGVGDQAQATSRDGVAGFGKMAGAVAAIGLAAADTIRRMEQLTAAIAKAADDAARAQQAVSGGLAQRLGGPDLTRTARLFGQSEVEFNRRLSELSVRFDQPQAQILAALEPLGARLVDRPELLQGAIDPTLAIGRSRGVFGEQAGLLAPLLAEQFGATTPQDISRGISGIVSAAEVSAVQAPAFGQQLTKIAATFQAGGVGLREQVGLISGTAAFFPTRPEQIGTALERIGDLSLRKTPFLKEVLSGQGRDPETTNAEEILESIIGFLRAGGDAQRLQTEGQIPFEVIRSITKAKTGAFAAARERGLRAFDIGFADPGIEQRRLQDVLTRKGAQLRGAATKAGLPEQEFGGAGTRAEAVDILSILEGRAAGGISREERLKFLTETNIAQKGTFFEDIAFTPEQALQLQSLNALFPQVMAALDRIATGRGGTTASPIRQRITELKRTLEATRTEANTPQLVGADQVEELPAYANAMRAAIRFIQQVRAGQDVTIFTRAIRGGPATREQITPSESTVEAAQGVGLFEGLSGANIQQAVFNQNGPESRPNNTEDKAAQ